MMNSMCCSRRVYSLLFSNICKRVNREALISHRSAFWTKKFSSVNSVNDERKKETDPSAEPMSDVNADEGLKQLKEENSKLLERVKELDNNYKRALADGENTRTRMRRQVEEAKIFGIQNFSKDLLDVADVLEKALTSVPEDAVKNSGQELKTLVEGIKLTEQQLQSVFRRHGLVKVNPIGSKFDPNEHHAMFEVEIADKEPGTVADVVKIGYKLHDRTIRPALVGVVKKK